MKKLVSLFLIIVMAFTMSACGKPEPIALDTNNIKSYLEFRFSYEDIEKSSALGFLNFGRSKQTLETYPISPGSFSDVTIELEVKLDNFFDGSDGWSVSSEDPAYDKNNSKILVYKFKLPASGDYSESHKISAMRPYGDLNSTRVDYSIKSVSGFFIPDR